MIRQIVNVEASTIALGAGCGTSAVVDLTTSAGTAHLTGGKLVVNVVHSTTNVPLHLEFRSVWFDVNGARNSTPVTQFLASNDETYGGSALVPIPLILLKSGQNVQLAIENLAGALMQVAVMAACAACAAVSAQVAVWQVD